MEFDWIPRVIGRLSNILKRSDISRMCILYTHQSFNIEPENDAFQKKLLFQGGIFSGSMLNFRVVYTLNQPVVFSLLNGCTQNPAPKKPRRSMSGC